MDDSLVTSQSLALSLHRATALLDRIADGYLRPRHGIGISAFAALVTIDALEPASQRRIAEGLDLSRAAVTQRLKDLDARGLVDVSSDPADGRSHLVTLSRAGRELLRQAWQGLATLDDGVDQGLDLVALQASLDVFSANAARYLATTEGEQ